MKKIHGWFIIFTGYVFGLLAIAILIAYLQNFMSIIQANPYVILMFICSIALNIMGAYVIQRCKE
jgi:predicted tellurium resistance membrane protein TerC